MLRRHFPLLMVLIILLANCSHGPTHNPVTEDQGELPPTGKNIETIAILGTNDLHGALGSAQLKTRENDGIAPIEYQAGGVAMIASYVKILRQEFGNHFVWLDAGDEFQGSIESNLNQGAPMVQFYNASGVQVATIGNHEFDYGPDNRTGMSPQDRLGALKARISEAHYPYVSANIVNKATGRLASDLLPGLLPHVLLPVGRLKLGVIGLSTEETPKTTSSINIQNLSFTDLKNATLKEAQELRTQGADLVVITAHVGLKCEQGRASASSHIRKPTEHQGDCGNRDEMVKLLKNLPAGTIDAVVAGHSHQLVHHWIAGVPVIQGGAYGRYLNVIYLNYDLNQKKLLTDLTRIEGPVPVCPTVFQNQNDCNGDRPAPKGGRGPLVAYQFHGQTLSEDTAIVDMLKPVFDQSAQVKKQVIATAARPIDHDRFKESALGNIVADAMRDATGAQVALMNAGGIRSNWEQGAITYGDVFRALPFDNTVVKSQVTGKELKTIIRLAESGSRGFFPLAGVKVRLIHPDLDAAADDLNQDGKIDPWEVNRIRSITLEDGSEIRDTSNYTFATLDFLLTGGDDLGWIMSKIPLNRQSPPPASLVRDAVLARLHKLAASGPINTVSHPIVDPSDPRIRFEKPAVPKRKAKHKRKRH
ncbi:5'-nucleotidase C-terminal domain-containing protein [Bdellovibrionota bacterium FG-1]